MVGWTKRRKLVEEGDINPRSRNYVFGDHIRPLLLYYPPSFLKCIHNVDIVFSCSCGRLYPEIAYVPCRHRTTY